MEILVGDTPSLRKHDGSSGYDLGRMTPPTIPLGKYLTSMVEMTATLDISWKYCR